jgi:hypothetical protein
VDARQILQPRKFVLDGLMFSLQLREGTPELLILCPQPPNLANQLANHANQVRLGQTLQPIRIRVVIPAWITFLRP